MNIIKRWGVAGVVAIVIIGSLLHDVYPWTGSSRIAGFFVPVNESVWEHLKLGYWSVVLFSVFEYQKVKSRVNNYYAAKLIGVIALELTILIVFYGYIFIAGNNILFLDIFSYILGAIVCQYLTYKIFLLQPFSRYIKGFSIVAFASIGIFFGIVTYYPPHLPIFKDNNDHTYGIYQEK